ncbi:MAG: sigma-70 family RNA polymerase sigma factor [Holophagales bacterium]|nr:MAG: sigma-70 family RNA polymerase sigma factor [Holophagales bacterium]
MADQTLSELFAAAEGGETGAFERAFTAIYGELKRLARRQRARSRPGDTLSTTVLVHEVFLKLSAGGALTIRDREHFFALAARAMRQILVDAARTRAAAKRGGPAAVRVELGEEDAAVAAVADDVVALDRALARLEAVDERLARLVEARYFAGLTDAEVAELLGRNERTVRRDWEKARAFLLRELRGGAPPGTSA